MLPRTPLLFTALFVLALSSMPATADPGIRHQLAIAHPRNAEGVLYRESHWQYQKDGAPRRLVLYQCPNGNAFARKTLVERGTAQAPDFAFEDARDGYREGVRSGPGGRVVYVSTAGADARERRLDVPAGAVIDAGFDASVRLHWDTLRAGRAVTQPFLLPSRFSFVPVRLDPGPRMQWNGIPAQRLSMKLDRWYGFVAPTMQLTYSSVDQRLLEFAGIATIRDDKGRHQDVRIVFPDPAAPATASALQAALSTPLVRRCVD